jgi:integrase
MITMAMLETVQFTPSRCIAENGKVQWTIAGASRLERLPQIFWNDGDPWREANLWLMERSQSRDVSVKTVVADATGLLRYASWLEDTGLDWWHFPQPRKDRCLVRYRGSLITAREDGALAPTTTSQRMRVVVAFYRWLKHTGLLSPDWPTWQERTVGVKLQDPFGFERTIVVGTTDISIPNRRTKQERLEDGVLPVTTAARDEILKFAHEYASAEVFLILCVGFFTGMRLGTICDLKVQTILQAVPDPIASGTYRLAIGPGASPPVATKFGVTGQVLIPESLLEQLRDYAYSVGRLGRQALADPMCRDILFLTRFGNSYAQRGSDKSVALNVEMHRLRARAQKCAAALQNFRFHQTRATYATQLARIAIKIVGVLHAIAIVREALLHRDEATALKYIRFVERTPVKEQLSNEFTAAFFGLVKSASETQNE